MGSGWWWWLIARVLNTEKPYWIRTLIGHRVAVEKIAHGFVEVSLAVPCGSYKCGTLALGRCSI